MLTHSMKQKILNIIIGRGDSNDGDSYLALSSTPPTENGGGVTEPIGNGYERTLIGSPKAGIYKMEEATIEENTHIARSFNDKEIHFNEATGEWGTLGWFAIYETLTGGTPKYVGSLASPINPTESNVVIVKVGDISITIE